jgi:hypothetical protein
VQKF